MTIEASCLLKRCLCHSFDPKCPPLMETTATTFIRNKEDNVGLVLNNKITASMKDVEYEVSTTFTKNDLLATKYGCHADSHDKERVLCVHTLPLIYQLIMFLDDGLAEHILVELCSR